MNTPLNPPAPHYTVPPGTDGAVARFDASWKPHRTRRELRFDHAYCFHGPNLPVFQVNQDWLFSVPLDCVTVRDHPVIYGLLFQIESSDRASQLIVWPDQYGHSPYARPKRRSDTMLDVRAFQEILWAGERREQELVVTEVQLYRCSRAAENGRVIDCGRAWLDQRVRG